MFESFFNSVQLTNNGVYYYSANVAAVNEWQNHLIFMYQKKLVLKLLKLIHLLDLFAHYIVCSERCWQ